MRTKLLYIIIISLFFQWIYSQEKKDDFLRFNIKYKNESLIQNKKYISLSKDTLQIETFRFYVSNIKLILIDNSEISEEKSYHLIDIEEPNSQIISISKNLNKEIKKVVFSLGIDSTASVSGALSGDLDPTKGMYWAWQSGYINFKIEGKSSSCKTRNNAFQFHVGGYLKPNYAIRTIELETKNSNFEINVDLAELFNVIKLSEINSIMIPGLKAMDIADKAKLMFTISESLPNEK
ncbi:MAG: hypothetical protein QE264_04950 [Flavobacterium sp.]|jgi:hypothetical protein|nr:hypothetical protein [Flavobacterium sp.]